MKRPRPGKVARWAMAIATLAILRAAPAPAQDHSRSMPLTKAHVDPSDFGVTDDTRTVISATSFLPAQGCCYGTSPSLGRYGRHEPGYEFYATLDLPAGAVIDFIGINSTTDTDGVLGVALIERNRTADTFLLAGFSAPAHGWDTDFAGPLGIDIVDHVDKEFVINVEVAPAGAFEFFSWVEIWWHRHISPTPQDPSFNDVPDTNPFFAYIEALKASGITGGCGGANYCPGASLTRGQMAVFLAKALGLHWPN
jgi:S-layer homology domain